VFLQSLNQKEKPVDSLGSGQREWCIPALGPGTRETISLPEGGDGEQ